MLNYKIKKLNSKQEIIKNELIKNGYKPLLARILALRNYSESNKLIHFSLLKDIDKASDYLLNAIINKKKMCVVADYDVDGATSCSIMVKGLKLLGADIKYFVPNRFIHGYGLQESVIDDMLNIYPDTQIIVTVDNGIASISGIKYAKEKNIDVLVTDHHLEGEERPEAIAIVNPNQKGCDFPSKSLAGCGVAFYVVNSVLEKFKSTDINSFNEEQRKIIEEAKKAKIACLLDYLAIGTIADVVTLDENNRLIVKLGLDRIHKGLASIGVKAILDALKIENNKLTSIDIAFRIAPMLNAAGRIEDMGKGIELLLSENYNDALTKAINLIEINQKRKDIEKSMKDTAMKQLNEQLMKSYEKGDKLFEENNNMFSSVVYHPDFHEGVIGILASRIKDMLYLPTIVFSQIHDDSSTRKQLKGSGRSIESIHLRDAIDYVYKNDNNCIVKFGGHSMAAGLTIYEDKLEDFKKLLNQYCFEILNGEKPTQVVEVDSDVDLVEVDIEEIENINKQIWGQNFREPVFYGEFKIIEQRILKEAHLKLKLEKNGITIDAMQFFNNKMYNTNKIEAIYKFNINEFRGKKSIQIFIDKANEVSNLD